MGNTKHLVPIIPGGMAMTMQLYSLAVAHRPDSLRQRPEGIIWDPLAEIENSTENLFCLWAA